MRKVAAPSQEAFLGVSSFFIDFNYDPMELVEIMTNEGFEHHFVVSYGQINEILEYFCKMSGIQKV